MADADIARTELERRQRANALEAAYAGIVIPEPALEDLRRSAFYQTTTAFSGTNGIDPYHTLLREGARMFLVELEKRMDKARRPRPEPPTTAVSPTAESV